MGNEYEEMKARLWETWRGLIIVMTCFFVITLVFFITLWLVTATNMGVGFTETLSWMLAQTSGPNADEGRDIRLMYIIWYFFFVVLNVLLLYSVFGLDMSVIENSAKDKTNRTMYCSPRVKHRVYVITTFLYLPLTFLKLLGFFLLWNSSSTSHAEYHYIWTAIALVASIVASFCLFLRRFANRHYVHVTDWVGVVLTLNASVIIAQIALGAVFAADRENSAGAIEFALAMTIGVDPVFQIIDSYHDISCPDTINHQIDIKTYDPVRDSELCPEDPAERLVTDLKMSLAPVVTRRLMASA